MGFTESSLDRPALLRAAGLGPHEDAQRGSPEGLEQYRNLA